jgi:hypothetical protein
LQNELPSLLEDVFLVKPLHMYQKNVGASPHFSLQVTDFLTLVLDVGLVEVASCLVIKTHDTADGGSKHL